MIRISFLVKVIISIPIFWLLFTIILSPSDGQPKDEQLVYEKERLHDLLKKNIDEVKKIKAQHEVEKQALMKMISKKNIRNEEKSDTVMLDEETIEQKNQNKESEIIKDHDHPEKERQEAEKQIKEKAGIIQVKAPDIKNETFLAPG